MRVAVLGLGEAGSLIAADLVRSGVEVRGYDPAPVPTPEGVERQTDPAAAVAGAGLVMAITAGSDAPTVLHQVGDHIQPSAVYADLAAAAPSLKRELAAEAATKNLPFADVALLGPVPGNGLATPALVSGSGAAVYAARVNALGGNVEVVGDEAGHASARKLMRSIVTKGLTALLLESMELAAAHGDSEWLWSHLVSELTSLDETLLDRMLARTGRHAARRVVEMEAAEQLLADLGIRASMTHGAVERLRRVLEEGLPESRER